MPASRFRRLPGADGPPHRRWLARVGAAGFLFFLAKGLVWIGVGVLVALGVRC